MTKAIFLDVDGVLNGKQYDKTRTADQSNIDESRLPLVREIISESGGAVIVLSSSWRRKFDEKITPIDEAGRQLQDQFSNAGLTVYDKTPVLSTSNDRAEEIRMWLRDHPKIQKFVIIDDMYWGWGELQDRLVKTNPFGRGLEEHHVRKAIEILNS